MTDVIWAIGWSMIVLAALVRVPIRYTVIFGLILVAGHHALDGIHASSFGSMSWAWTLLHESGMIRLPWGANGFVGYPLVPWIGVMPLGYAAGALLSDEPARRRRRLTLLGGGMLAAFVILRGANLYGDPQPWSMGANPLVSAFSFVSCHKYPPSLLYLLMTLGPAMLALAALDRVHISGRNSLLVFGRVPLFYYVVHLYAIHLAAGLAFLPRLGAVAFHVDPDSPPLGYGVSLGRIYLIWAVAVLAMYPLCAWFAGVKQRRRGGWLSYL